MRPRPEPLKPNGHSKRCVCERCMEPVIEYLRRTQPAPEIDQERKAA